MSTTAAHPMRRATDHLPPQHPMHDHLTKIAIAAVAAIAGWTGQSLTLGGRVDGIERALIRIEARIEGQQQQRPAPAPR